MKLAVDEALCSGHGRCYVVAGSLFTSDDEGYCGQRGQMLDIPVELEADATRAVESCPEGAIRPVAGS
jgi:ferredoxin